MEASGEDAGRCGRRHKEFSSLGQEEDYSKSWKGKKWRRSKRCISPHLPGTVPADSQTLTGAVPNPEDIRTSKASRFELRSRCPSQLQEPRSSFRGQAGSMKNQQQRPKTCSEAQGTWGHGKS